MFGSGGFCVFPSMSHNSIARPLFRSANPEDLGERLRCVVRILAAQNRRLACPLGGHELADLAQDTVLVILQKLTSFRGDAPFEPWLCRICQLELWNRIRRVRRAPRLADMKDVPDESVDAADEVVARREAVEHAIDQLAWIQAQAVRLRIYRGLSFDEMARAAGVPPSTIKTRYYSALAHLRFHLHDVA